MSLASEPKMMTKKPSLSSHYLATMAAADASDDVNNFPVII